MTKTISDWELRQYCKASLQQDGMIQDETWFLNGLRLMAYPQDGRELIQRCVEQRFIKIDGGNVIIKVR